MARLDDYAMPGKTGRRYVVDVQAALLDHLATRVVVPLIAQDKAAPPISGLNPVFDIVGEQHVMVTQAIATVPTKELRRVVGSVDNRHDEITKALDILLIGF